MSAYWVVAYRAIHDRDRLAAYAELAAPAIEAAGGRFVARGPTERVFEAGLPERTVVVVFDDVDAAVAAYGSPAYREALDALGDAAERDVRIVDGVD